MVLALQRVPIRSELTIEISPEAKEFAECPQDDGRSRPGSATAGPREVRNRDFCNVKPHAAGLDEELSAEGRSPGVDDGIPPNVAPKELERAVNVSGRVAKQGIDKELPTPGVEQSQRWVRALSPPSNDEINVSLHGSQKPINLADIELLIPIGHEDKFHARRVESTCKSSAVSLVGLVCDDAQMDGSILLQAIQNLTCTVSRSYQSR